MSTDCGASPTVSELLAEMEAFNDPDFVNFPSPPGDEEGISMFMTSRLMPLATLTAVALADDPGPTGGEIRDEFKSVFGRTASPGTLYPLLEEYRDEGALAQREFAQGQRQCIGDPAKADAHLAEYEEQLRWLLRVTLSAREALNTDANTDLPSTESEAVGGWEEAQ